MRVLCAANSLFSKKCTKYVLSNVEGDTNKIFRAKHAPDRHPWIPASAGMTDPGNTKIANFRQIRNPNIENLS